MLKRRWIAARIGDQHTPRHTAAPAARRWGQQQRLGLRPLVLLLALFIVLAGLPLYGSVLGQTPSPTAPTSPTHRVQAGETLSEIAVRYGISQSELMALNSITDSDAIYIGQILVLPRVPAETTPEPAPTIAVDAAFAEPDPSSTTHIVQPGENLTRIARRYGLSLDELMRINGITEPDAIQEGRRLRLTPAMDTETAQAAPEPAPQTRGPAIATLNPTYEVGPGDTIARIALRFGVDEEALRYLNGLDEENSLQLNQELILPATPRELAVTAPEPKPVQDQDQDAETTDPRAYTVQTGDSLSLIAQDHGLSLAELMQANQIDNPDAIYIGQSLRIPAPAVITETTAVTTTAVTVSPDAAATGALTATASASPTETSTGIIAGTITETVTETVTEVATETVTGTVTGAISPTTRPAPVSSLDIGPPRRGFFYYTVKPGDTLSTLAREFDSTQLALMEYNNLPNAETVYADLELRIPYGPPPLAGMRPPTPLGGTRFLVSLSRQQCWVLRGDRVLYAWTCSTGYGEWITRTGVFAVQTKMELAKSTAYELDMPYWLGIYDVGAYENGIHGLPVAWETGEKIWEELVGQPATFGCAMLDDDDAATLFHLAYVGMPVHIVP